MKKSLFSLFVVFLIAFMLGSCKTQSHNFFKQKYLKGNLKTVYEGGQESVQETVTFKDDAGIEIDFKTEQEVENALVSDKIDNDEIEIIEASERPRKITGDGLDKVFRGEKFEQRNSKFVLFEEGSGKGEKLLSILVLIFLIISIASILLFAYIGWWAFLVSFGLMLLSFGFWLWLEKIAKSKSEKLFLAVAIILFFPLALILLLLSMLITLIA